MLIKKSTWSMIESWFRTKLYHPTESRLVLQEEQLWSSGDGGNRFPGTRPCIGPQKMVTYSSSLRELKTQFCHYWVTTHSLYFCCLFIKYRNWFALVSFGCPNIFCKNTQRCYITLPYMALNCHKYDFAMHAYLHIYMRERFKRQT